MSHFLYTSEQVDWAVCWLRAALYNVIIMMLQDLNVDTVHWYSTAHTGCRQYQFCQKVDLPKTVPVLSAVIIFMKNAYLEEPLQIYILCFSVLDVMFGGLLCVISSITLITESVVWNERYTVPHCCVKFRLNCTLSATVRSQLLMGSKY
jgi:hypothetical protein